MRLSEITTLRVIAFSNSFTPVTQHHRQSNEKRTRPFCEINVWQHKKMTRRETRRDIRHSALLPPQPDPVDPNKNCGVVKNLSARFVMMTFVIRLPVSCDRCVVMFLFPGTLTTSEQMDQSRSKIIFNNPIRFEDFFFSFVLDWLDE